MAEVSGLSWRAALAGATERDWRSAEIGFVQQACKQYGFVMAGPAA